MDHGLADKKVGTSFPVRLFRVGTDAEELVWSGGAVVPRACCVGDIGPWASDRWCSLERSLKPAQLEAILRFRCLQPG